MTNRDHAIVLGGSMAGLFAARVLSDHFKRVTIVERDPVNDYPESRKGQPHTRHTHAVLAPAHHFIRDYLPQAYSNLLDHGAFTVDSGSHAVVYGYGGYSNRVPNGLEILNSRRPNFEYYTRNGVLNIENVDLLDDTKADELLLNDERTKVIGIKVTRRQEGRRNQMLHADLVVDACGRGTPTPSWLSRISYDAPEKEEVKINVQYVTRLYKRQGEYVANPHVYLIIGTPPTDKVTGTMIPAEDDTWYITLTGFHGHPMPANNAEFMEAVRNLPTQDIYNILSKSEPISDILAYKYPTSRRLRYDKLKRFPDGFLVLGDSVASFNPVYGQGMSSAALQAQALDRQLRSNAIDWRTFFKEQAKVVNIVWTMAVGADFRFPETDGKKAPGTDLINGYMKHVNIASHTDSEVAAQYSRVIHLLDSPTSLFHPRIIWRVIRSAQRRSLGQEIPPETMTSTVSS